MKKLSYLLSSLYLFVANLAAAQGLTPPPPPTGLPVGVGGRLTGTLLYYINIFLAVVGIIAVAYLIYGGFRYITSGGNEETAEDAKKIITNSIIGLIVIILSYVIVTVVINALRGQI